MVLNTSDTPSEKHHTSVSALGTNLGSETFPFSFQGKRAGVTSPQNPRRSGPTTLKSLTSKEKTDDEPVLLHELFLEQGAQCTSDPKEHLGRHETPGSILPTVRTHLGGLRKEQRTKGVEQACSFVLSAQLP